MMIGIIVMIIAIITGYYRDFRLLQLLELSLTLSLKKQVQKLVK